jgi:hypothetical protein
MRKHEDDRERRAGPAEPAGGTGQLGVYRPGFRYRDAALGYFRQCVGDEVYRRAMSSEAGKRHHYVVARAFLSQTDWEKFVWIEEYGTLAGFPD